MAPSEQPARSHRYTAELAGLIEGKWQDRWEREETFAAPNPAGDLAQTPRGKRATDMEPAYFMDMFPYPSGRGLHVGHPLGYVATDVHARYNRMLGKNVMHALGYDAFGLPAEQYAVQTGQHPRVTTEENIANMRSQLRRLGLGHDARRTFATTDPEFVKWTQWIFVQIFDSWYDPQAADGRGAARPITELIAQFEAGRDTGRGAWAELDAAAREDVLQDYRLAYVSESPVNWCPGLGTVLANEEVTAEGRSERGNFPVFTRRLRQWNMRITAYADRLVDDLDAVDWPESVKQMQRNWIGRSTGALLRFSPAAGAASDAGPDDIEVYTTRADTLFGGTFLVLSPEHPLVEAYTAQRWPAGTPEPWTGGADTPAAAIAAYRRAAAAKTPLERQEGKDKTGVFTGTSVVNPATGEAMPVFVADYVLMGYGTGAVMGVPAEDPRDWDFAQAYGLPYVRTVQPAEDHPEDRPYTGEGEKINSANAEIDLNGRPIAEAKAAIVEWLGERAEATTQYRLRDWLFSRQRYWGEPFPIVYDEAGVPHALPADQLPVDLPEVPDFSPRTFAADDVDSEPEPPLGRNADWVSVELDLGDGPRRYRRETNTMPNWAGSSWYQLRYADPHNDAASVGPENEAYWLGPRGAGDSGGADLYVGGVEHAVLHLLYARFWHKVLFDLGHISSWEPFRKLINQGYIQAYAFTDARGVYVPADEVEEHTDEAGNTTYTHGGQPVAREYGKMGKSLKNMVTPEDMYAAFGADTFRVYEMSMGPLVDSRPWETRAVVGAQRFLQRVWRLAVDEETGETAVSDEPADGETRRVLHQTIAGVREDMDHFRYNTVVAKLIVLVNHLTKAGSAPREAMEPLAIMLAPLAPHLAEEIWERMGHDHTITYAPYPVADESQLRAEAVTCVVQVRGKVRDRLEVDPEIDPGELEALAIASDGAQKFLQGAAPLKVIVRAPKLVNIVPAQ